MAELCPDLGGDLFTMSRLMAGQAPSSFAAATIEVSPVSPKAGGSVYAAILGTANFDATTVDPASARLGRDAGHAFAHAVADINDDGKPDLQLQFRTQETGIGCFDKAVFVQAATTTGKRVRGYDLIAPDCPAGSSR